MIFLAKRLEGRALRRLAVEDGVGEILQVVGIVALVAGILVVAVPGIREPVLAEISAVITQITGLI